MSHEVRAFLADLEREGWVFERTSKGHYRGKHPRAPRKVLIVPGSPSDHRTMLNTKAVARRLVS